MSTALKTATAVGYFRVSSPRQTGERHVSLEVQEAAFRDYCQRQNRTALRVFTDIASGRKDDRREYQAMLEYVDKYHPDEVVVLYLDRFGRNPREILRRYWELQDHGTEVISLEVISLEVISLNEDLKEELLLLVRAGMAGAESRRMGERVSMAL